MPTSEPKPAGETPAVVTPVAPGPAAAASPSPAAAGVTVKMVETAFEPDRITVPAGTTVTWDNTSLSRHTVTAEGGTFDSGSDPAKWLQSGQKFSFTFTAPGTFNYYCLPHQQLGMVGTVIVE